MRRFWNNCKNDNGCGKKKQTIRSKVKIKRRPTTRNKDLTKILILDAARRIIDAEGYKKLGINKLAHSSGRSKKMIYDYFGGKEGIATYLLQERDTWLSYQNKMEKTIAENSSDYGRELAISAFEKHFYQIKGDPLLQEFGLLELSDDDQFLNDLAEKRERLADQLFSITDDHFKDTDVSFRAVCAILNSGINHLVLHSKIRNSPYCGIDINSPSDREKLIDTIKLIINSAYDVAKNTTVNKC